MCKGQTSYCAKLHDKDNKLVVTTALFVDENRIKEGRPLGCVVRPQHCELYYNEGNLSADELRKAGYGVVDALTREDVYYEQTKIY